jgi:hypothetical protein
MRPDDRRHGSTPSYAISVSSADVLAACVQGFEVFGNMTGEKPDMAVFSSALWDIARCEADPDTDPDFRLLSAINSTVALAVSPAPTPALNLTLPVRVT